MNHRMPMPKLTVMPKVTRSPKFVGLLVAVALTIAACGSDTAAGPSAEQPGSGGTEPTPTAGAEDPAASPDDDRVWERVGGRDDLISLQPGLIDNVVVADDDRTLLVRYSNAAEPCSGANVTATESDREILVELEVGLDPNAAAMTCVAGVFDYEIAVALNAPVGDREIVLAGGALDAPAGVDVALDMSRFVGLTFDDAVALAEEEDRVWRLGREDDEIFAVTMDYNPERVTFEVDDGVVTLAVAG